LTRVTGWPTIVRTISLEDRAARWAIGLHEDASDDPMLVQLFQKRGEKRDDCLRALARRPWGPGAVVFQEKVKASDFSEGSREQGPSSNRDAPSEIFRSS
jgi:hypothetical protein